MAFISDRLTPIAPSASVAIFGQAKAMVEAGKDVINLAAGQPDFDTPDFIKAAAKDALDAGETGYTAVDGSAALKQAIIHKFQHDNGLTFAADQITVNSGGKQTIFNALAATLNVGDQVIIPAPFWVSYTTMVRLNGGVPVIITASQQQDFKITPDQLAAAITPRTKWVILNNPSNPTGAVYSRRELQALGAVLDRHPAVWILADEIYEHVIYDDFEDQKLTSFAAACPQLSARTFTVNGLSKAYAMTGWRIGYGAGGAVLISAIATIQGQTTSCPSSLSQAAGVAALTGPQDFLTDWRQEYQSRRDLICSALAEIEGISCHPPKGAFYVFASVQKLLGKSANTRVINTDVDFADYLLSEYLLAVVPGSAFGMDGFIRLSYAASTQELRRACERLKQAVNSLT